MANRDEDVIELGSSDEEWEPSPKKKKPTPMVRIPNKLPGVTIKPANKPKINPVSFAANANIGKGLTVTKVFCGNKVSNPFANKNQPNGKPVRNLTVQAPRILPMINSALTIKPTLKKKQAVTVGQIPLQIAKGVVTTPSRVRQLPQGALPPGITVKRTSQLQSGLGANLRANPVNIQAQRKAIQACKRPIPSELVCVDLDEDDIPPSCAGPQWYLRPEEGLPKNKSMEIEEKMDDTKDDSEDETGTTDEGCADLNNKEPETRTYIEITIEDSPSKPKSKRACEVSELAITIDDSPVKGTAEKPAPDNSSDEDENTTSNNKEKHSKKKLEYAKNSEKIDTVEIEIELIPVENHGSQSDNCIKPQDGASTEVLEINESPVKSTESFHTSTPKKLLKQIVKNDNKSPHVLKPHLKLNEVNVNSKLKPQVKPNVKNNNKSKPELKLNKNKTSVEFHPSYQSFIDLCFQLENSEDMKKIVEKKIKAYYKQVPKDYTESEVFMDMVASKISAMKASPEKMYLYIKDVVDELNMQRKIAKTQPVKLDTVNEEQEKFLYGEESEFDSKRQRQIRKLEKTLKKLHRAIQKLEEQEVDFDDEEDSVYLLTESEEGTSKDIDQPLEKSERLKRYKERMIRVHAKFCQLTNTKMPSEPRVQIDARPGQHKGPAKRLEKWVNKKVPIGTPLPFPDFHDVLRCVREANQEDKLGWNEADIMEEARDLFTRCGKKLQRRRQENEWRLAASRIQSELDPAVNSEDLKKKLEDNRRVASKKESEVLNKYADRQNQLNLEAVEIEDKEADESPVETDEDESMEEKASLETKEKRKERLKRLLQEKSKKMTDETELFNIENEIPDDTEAKASGVNLNDGNSQNETENVKKDTLAGKQNENPLANEDNKKTSDTEKIHSLSDDSQRVDSDIDELHLLQKLHSDVIDSSTLESSDSESPIAISDTLSSGDNRKHASDVISIENSSYSESEKNNEQEYELVSYSQKKVVTESVDVQMEIECSNAGIEKKINKSNNDEYNEDVEDILLASSDDEASKDPKDRIATDLNTEILDKNADITDDSLIESIEMSVAKNTNGDTMKVSSVTSRAISGVEISDLETVGGEPTSKLTTPKTSPGKVTSEDKTKESVGDGTTKQDKSEDTNNEGATGCVKSKETVPDAATNDDHRHNILDTTNISPMEVDTVIDKT